MEVKVCWNTKCPATNSCVSKLGWRLLSGRVAELCEFCGLIFDQSIFCETFHGDEAGWRTCNTCRKRLHCGCIVSASNIVHLDLGGVECVTCSKRAASGKMAELSSDSTSLTRACSLKLSESSEDEQRMPEKKQRLADAYVDAMHTRQTQHLPVNDFFQREVCKVLPHLGSEQRLLDGNSTVVPLFEKVLTASDAGRIGRLILPKACAEAFFPPISAPEGIPIKMTDVLGQDWQFQFRFWPNNSSRMYVLEGITPCVKSLQLQAGDVVTFSRIEPGDKMVLGYRRNSTTPPPKNNKSVRVASPSPRASSLKTITEASCSKTLGPSSSWEEPQDLLTPPPGVTPSIMTIDGHKFEEYEEPPVLLRRMLPLAG